MQENLKNKRKNNCGRRHLISKKCIKKIRKAVQKNRKLTAADIYRD
jgi:hypothetical protein